MGQHENLACTAPIHKPARTHPSTPPRDPRARLPTRGLACALHTRRAMPKTPRLTGCALLLLTGLAGGCTARASTAELYPEVVEHAGRKVDDVRFTGAEPFSRDTLLTMINTQPSRCNFLGLPICVPFVGWGRQEFHLQPERVRQDVASLARFYRAEGYFGTRVTPQVDLDGDDAVVTFEILRGDPILVDLLEVTGTEGVVDPDSLEGELPLQPGEVFRLGEFSASWDQVRRELTSRGHAYAEVLRNFSVDTIDNRAVASLDAIPGPRVVVDTILVRGADNLGRTATLRQLAFRQGDVLRRSRLAESQRNLYELELVQIAAVTIAPDSLQRFPGDSSRATVLVQVAEAPVHQIDWAVGFGSVDCLRTEAQWVNRSLGGGARRLALFGSVSKIGIGEPLDIGSGDQVCRAYRGQEAAARFDYRLSADLSQPYFMGPRNRLALNAFMERISEPNIFQREAVGSRLSVTRRLGDRSVAALALDAERGSTLATPALFCAAFQVCDPALADSLGRARFRNELALNWTLDRTNSVLNPSSGYALRSGLGWATALLGSEVRFLRWTGEAQIYRGVRPGWVAAGALRLGNFFRTATLDPTRNFLPPEERFFAGGASSVRGYDRNALGQGVWVTDDVTVSETGDTVPTDGATFVPTGGTTVAVATAELRFPSPFLPRLLRLAAFVDAGTIGTRSLQDLALGDWKITPGMGLRFQTPVGPLRLDVAYNPYDPTAGPLLLRDDESGTLRRVGQHQPGTPSFLQRLRIHFAVGQAF